jgi:hypothetical protein
MVKDYELQRFRSSIYTASQPQNAGGAVSPQSLRGNVAGLDLYVSRALGSLTCASPTTWRWINDCN